METWYPDDLIDFWAHSKETDEMVWKKGEMIQYDEKSLIVMESIIFFRSSKSPFINKMVAEKHY